MYLSTRAGAISLNLVVPKLAYLEIDWFNCTKSQQSSGSIAPFSKIKWFYGTTGTTTKAGPAQGWSYKLILVQKYSSRTRHMRMVQAICKVIELGKKYLFSDNAFMTTITVITTPSKNQHKTIKDLNIWGLK